MQALDLFYIGARCDSGFATQAPVADAVPNHVGNAKIVRVFESFRRSYFGQGELDRGWEPEGV